MKEGKKAVFTFERYQIPNFVYNEPPDGTHDISVAFEPSGVYHQEKGIFEVHIIFKAFLEEQQHEVVNALFIAYFHFQEKPSFEELPIYFYRNSIAIAFPFVRAFISTLTLQANVKPMILPVLNLSNLEQPLRENTKVI